MGFNEVSAIAYPALGVSNIRLLPGIGRIAIIDQGAAERTVPDHFFTNWEAKLGKRSFLSINDLATQRYCHRGAASRTN
jgi:hypothetical protein